jgi:hypothetical protein
MRRLGSVEQQVKAAQVVQGANTSLLRQTLVAVVAVRVP